MLRDPERLLGTAVLVDAAQSSISVVMPLGDWNEDARRCVGQVSRLLRPDDECILVADGFPMTEAVPAGCRVVSLAAHGGPAVARNAGAREARGAILFFVDADVLLDPDAMDIVRRHFRETDAAAVFGSYDEKPSAPTLVSRFRNLLHHAQHQSHAGPVRSFWTGCGAIRRGAFEALGGFSVRYDRPAMEDIELGARLARAGGEIRLDPRLLCKHLKCWTLHAMIVTDIRDRAIPWSRLLYRDGRCAAVLNADARGRVSLICTAIIGASLALGPFWPRLWITAAAAWLALLLAQRGFLTVLRRVGGLRLLAAGAILLPVHFACGAVGFGYVTAEVALLRLRKAFHAGRR